MIIYSRTGAKPNDLAYQKINQEKNICCVQIKDKKYHITKSLAKEKLDDVFDGKTPYCLCDEVEKTQGELKPFYNPAIVCSSDKGNWVMLKNYELIPIGCYKQMDKLDIFYLDFEYEPKVEKSNVKYLPKQQDFEGMRFKNDTCRAFWGQLKDLFTPFYKCLYSEWDKDFRCWVQDYDGKPRHPIGYPQFTILKTGGWDADWASIIGDEKFKEGHTSNKTIGKIEKYIMDDIKQTKNFARKNAFDMEYDDKEYYMVEMQSAFLVLRMCLFLKKSNIEIKEPVLKYMADKVGGKSRYGSTYYGLDMNVYINSHIEDLFDKVL